MPASSTRKMSDRHEEDLVDILGGSRTRNSGAVWSDQGDGHQTALEGRYRFTWDGKSTLGKSIGVTVEMWRKLQEQSRGLLPVIPLRWYRDNRCTQVELDLVAIELDTFAEMQHDANKYHQIIETGCHEGTHDFQEPSVCSACGASPREASVIPEDR